MNINLFKFVKAFLALIALLYGLVLIYGLTKLKI